jgi:hypothetical protein
MVNFVTEVTKVYMISMVRKITSELHSAPEVLCSADIFYLVLILGMHTM